MHATPVAWIAKVSTMSDRPQVQFTLSNRFILVNAPDWIMDGLPAVSFHCAMLTTMASLSARICESCILDWTPFARSAGPVGVLSVKPLTRVGATGLAHVSAPFVSEPNSPCGR
jgi:hypothetical protein